MPVRDAEHDYLSARVPADLAAKFRQLCSEDERPVSQELRRLVRQRVAQNDEGRPAQAAPVQEPVSQDRHDAG